MPDDIEPKLSRAREARLRQGAEIADTLAALVPTTFTSLLRRRAHAWRGRPALAFREATHSYDELLTRIDAARRRLAASGVRPGEAVALLLDNSDTYVIWYLAVLDAGAIAVPLNTKSVAREIGYILANSGAVLTVSDARLRGLLTQVVREDGTSPAVLMADAAADSPVTDAPWPGHAPASLDEPAALYYTSGTTGMPKGVVHTHRSQIAIGLQSPPAWEYDLDELVALAVTPLFHIASHTIFLPVLLLGGMLIVEPYRTEETLKTLVERRVTSFFGVPSILLMLVERARECGIRVPNLRTLNFGAAPMPVHKLAEVQALFPNAGLIHGMGQTESAGTIVTLPSSLAFDRAGSVGFALPGVEIAIFDDADRPLPAGTVGELVARGPNVMREYYANPDATRDTLRSGWLHTGDLGYCDEDGLVFLVDRKKDMIIRGGENIYSTEVEHVLTTFPSIAQAAVIGKPDPLFGEQVCAFVTLKEGAAPLPVEAVLAHCRTMLASYKVPVDLRLIDEMPMTATGKIQKGELRNLL